MTEYIEFGRLKEEVAAARTPEQQVAYEASYDDAEAAIEPAQLVYGLRTAAGLSQTELARRMGAAQPYVSAIERGAKIPTVATLHRIAEATGNRLELTVTPA